MSSKEVELKKFIKELEAEKMKLEDVESERDVLQERLTQQQVTISSLQATLQSSKHKAAEIIVSDTYATGSPLMDYTQPAPISLL